MPLTEQRPRSERLESALPLAVFSVPKYLVSMKLLHSVILVFKDTFFPCDLTSKHEPKILYQVLRWRKSSSTTRE